MILRADRRGLFFQVNMNPSGAHEGILRAACLAFPADGCVFFVAVSLTAQRLQK
jgi:hypothetical protein